MPDAAVVTLHGMGRTAAHYAKPFLDALDAELGASAALRTARRPVYYQHALQVNESELWRRCAEAGRVRWGFLRRFMLFNFGDAVGLEAGKDEPHSSYQATQADIARALIWARDAMGGNLPLVVVAHSLGGQVFSCYVYDAQKARRALEGLGHWPSAGIWSAGRASVEAALGRPLDDATLDFLAGRTLSAFVTLGCNIPVFIAAHREMDIRPIDPAGLGPGFEWHNDFNPNDPLGWPLQPLSPGYHDLVADHVVMAGNLLTRHTPFSHTAYWSDRTVVRQVAGLVRRALAA